MDETDLAALGAAGTLLKLFAAKEEEAAPAQPRGWSPEHHQRPTRRATSPACHAPPAGGVEAAARPRVKAAAKLRPVSVENRIDMSARKILEFLELHGSDQWIRESAIRLALSNTPDTSKGLRKLRSEGQVLRRGMGGRLDAFRYMLKCVHVRLASEGVDPEAVGVHVPPAPAPVDAETSSAQDEARHSMACDTAPGCDSPQHCTSTATVAAACADQYDENESGITPDVCGKRSRVTASADTPAGLVCDTTDGVKRSKRMRRPPSDLANYVDMDTPAPSPHRPRPAGSLSFEGDAALEREFTPVSVVA